MVFCFMGFSALNRTSYITTVLLVVIPFPLFRLPCACGFSYQSLQDRHARSRVSLGFRGEMKQWETATCIEQYRGMEIPTSAPSFICSP